MNSPEPVLRERDWTIAERLDEIERALKFDPAPLWYRRELMREYLAYTDPEERHEHR